MPDFKLTLFSLTADILNAAAAIGVPAFVGMGLNYLRQKFRLNIQEQTQQHLTALAQDAVFMAGQKLKDQPGSAKLQAAKAQVQERAKEAKIKLTSNAAELLIEAAVGAVKTRVAGPQN